MNEEETSSAVRMDVAMRRNVADDQAEQIISSVWNSLLPEWGPRPSDINTRKIDTDRGGLSRYELNATYEDGTVIEVEIRYGTP